MPTPEKDESKTDYIERCVKQLTQTEGVSQEAAIGKCESLWTTTNHDSCGCRQLMQLDGELISIEMADTRIPVEHTENADEEVYRSVALVGDRFYKGRFMPWEAVKKAAAGLDGTFHDVNHFGTAYPGVMGMPVQNIGYIIGYQKNTMLDEANKRIITEIHISKKAQAYPMWKGFMDINKNAGRIPNVSVSLWHDTKPMKIRDLPGGAAAYATEGYKEDQTVDVMSNIEFRALSTVMRGACNDTHGCGIGMQEGEDLAVWTTAYIDTLPDSCFAYIEPGGTKDSEGKTTPRSKRHFPYKDASGKVDLVHLRNALARASQSPFGDKALQKLRVAAKEAGVGNYEDDDERIRLNLQIEIEKEWRNNARQND